MWPEKPLRRPRSSTEGSLAFNNDIRIEGLTFRPDGKLVAHLRPNLRLELGTLNKSPKNRLRFVSALRQFPSEWIIRRILYQAEGFILSYRYHEIKSHHIRMTPPFDDVAFPNHDGSMVGVMLGIMFMVAHRMGSTIRREIIVCERRLRKFLLFKSG